MFFKRVMISGVLASLMLAQSSFAEDSSQPTFQVSQSTQNGQTYRSFQFCQNGNCQQFGPSSQYPVSWLSQQGTLHNVDAKLADVGTGLAGVGSFVGMFLTPATGVGLAAVAIGANVEATHQKNMAVAASDVTAGGVTHYTISFQDKQIADQFKNSLGNLLNQYGKSSVQEEVVRAAKQAWSGAVSSAKTLGSDILTDEQAHPIGSVFVNDGVGAIVTTAASAL